MFWLALPPALLWWGFVAGGTDGYDGEVCGERASYTDACIAALDFGEAWGGRFLLYAVMLGVVLPLLPRADRYAVLRGTVFAAAMACLLASVVANAYASHHHDRGSERSNSAAVRAPHNTRPSPDPSNTP